METTDKIADPDPQGPPRDAADRSLAMLVGQLLLSRAAEMARAGRHELAEAVLSDLVRLDPAPRVLDLLARVVAQQGRLAQAKDLWRQILRDQPDDEAAQAALRRIEQLENKDDRNRPRVPEARPADKPGAAQRTGNPDEHRPR